MNTWFAVDITVESEATEAVESALNILDAIGTEIDMFPKAQGEPRLVTGFFDAMPDESVVRSAAKESLAIYGFAADAIKGIATRVVEESDWLAEWKKHWIPTTVGRFIIAPPWADIGETDAIVIRIEPNMAFGTGTHETTQLCLQAIDNNFRVGQSFLDVGTGTGILAIAAAKLTTESIEEDEKAHQNKFLNSVSSVLSVVKILAFDTDADSIKIANENAAANGVSACIEFDQRSIGNDTHTFDFICANLTLDVIVPLLPLLLEKAKKTLVLSGILAEQRDTIATEIEKFQISNSKSEIAGLKFETKGEWIAVIVTNGA